MRCLNMKINDIIIFYATCSRFSSKKEKRLRLNLGVHFGQCCLCACSHLLCGVPMPCDKHVASANTDRNILAFNENRTT